MEFDEKYLQKVREDRFLINQYDQWLINEIEPYIGQRIMDIGCGLGNLLAYFKARQLVVGIDTSEESIQCVTQKFAANKNIRALVWDINSPQSLDLAKFNLDTIVSLNVFEHIEDDATALNNVYKILAHNSTLVLIVPAHAWLYGSMDSSIGHYRRYTKAMLKQKLDEAGFQTVQLKYINFLGAVGWFINGKLLKRKTPPADQLKLLNRWIPLLHKIETRIRPPFGISLLAIARKI